MSSNTSSPTSEQYAWRSRHHTPSDVLLREHIIREGISQSKQSANEAHWSFLSAIALSTASAVIGLAGAAFLLLGHASEGSVTAAVGLASGVYSHQLSKEAADRQKRANERLDYMLQELQSMQSSN